MRRKIRPHHHASRANRGGFAAIPRSIGAIARG
ncbi:hypothetical protein NK6_1540 [Bradyrhizobium diazoefficiens]|uniref:Uncharacterized protein n=1 Tax=Bradyrhizobium diazoefficiens TaxID=1355477 RepID=A0A0E4FT41_9BRAD|nr:hypothetical protein NK6_1540 [Bradyrhizobium diazoefficiens]